MNKHRRVSEFEKPMVPIVPMLDLTFQLLFFFITLFDPSAASRLVEGQMDLMLPKEDKKGQASAPEDVLPETASDKEDEPLEIPADLTVLVTTQLDGVNDGNISSLAVEDRAGKTPIDYDKKLTDLVKYLKEQREKSENTSIRVQGDSKLKWEAMVQVMDACRRAGFENVGFMQPPDFNLSGP
jgi:biopolymer transport protein ExbD